MTDVFFISSCRSTVSYYDTEYAYLNFFYPATVTSVLVAA